MEEHSEGTQMVWCRVCLQPKETMQYLPEELMTVSAQVLGIATFSLFTLTFYIPDAQSSTTFLNKTLEPRKEEVSE